MTFGIQGEQIVCYREGDSGSLKTLEGDSGSLKTLEGGTHVQLEFPIDLSGVTIDTKIKTGKALSRGNAKPILESVPVQEELLIGKKSILFHINNSETIFKDVDLGSVDYGIIELDGHSRDFTRFFSDDIEFGITNFGSSAIYYVNGEEFNQNELSIDKRMLFCFLLAKLGLSKKGKLKNKSLINESNLGNEKEVNPQSSSAEYLQNYSTNWVELPTLDEKYLHEPEFITEKSAILHFMVKGGKKYRITLEYNIYTDIDTSNGKNVGKLSINTIESTQKGNFISEGRLSLNEKRKLNEICRYILNKGSFNPYIRTDDE